jgi:hypothetical protein
VHYNSVDPLSDAAIAAAAGARRAHRDELRAQVSEDLSTTQRMLAAMEAPGGFTSSHDLRAGSAAAAAAQDAPAAALTSARAPAGFDAGSAAAVGVARGGPSRPGAGVAGASPSLVVVQMWPGPGSQAELDRRRSVLEQMYASMQLYASMPPEQQAMYAHKYEETRELYARLSRELDALQAAARADDTRHAREAHPARTYSEDAHPVQALAASARSQSEPVHTAALPAGWVELVDQASGCAYYAHTATATSQWERPI